MEEQRTGLNRVLQANIIELTQNHRLAFGKSLQNLVFSSAKECGWAGAEDNLRVLTTGALAVRGSCRQPSGSWPTQSSTRSGAVRAKWNSFEEFLLAFSHFNPLNQNQKHSCRLLQDRSKKLDILLHLSETFRGLGGW